MNVARKVNPKEVKVRIKSNKEVMKEAKKILNNEMSAAAKCEKVDAPNARKSLADFLKAANAVRVDTAKLQDAD